MLARDDGKPPTKPSEFAKIVLILSLVAFWERFDVRRFRDVLGSLALVGVPALLILKQPNLGTALITTMVGAAVFWAAGMRWWKFAGLAGIAAIAAPIAYDRLHDYQRAIDCIIDLARSGR